MNPSTQKKRTRQTYDSDIKIAARFGVLPEEIAQCIPKSTLSTFKTSDHSHILRLESFRDFKERFELLKRIFKLNNIVKILKSYILVKDTIISIYSKIKVIKPYLKFYKEKIVTSIKRVTNTFTLKRACKYFKISKNRFFSWLHQVNHSCPASVLKMCRHRWSNQITQKEESTMVKLYNDPFYKGWAVYQIAVHALLHNKLSVSVGTWYKYMKILGINRNNIKKKINKTGIRASKPNELWHMDVTLYTTVDNVTARIYILIDNKSRFILNWKVAPYLSGKVSLDMVRESYHKYLTPAVSTNPETMLLVDGGPENNNSDMDNFLNREFIPIKKLIAQKDIKFSNSMVEAFNKTLKYRHLFPHNITDYESLVKHLKKCIPEYNNIRRHCAHKYLTPVQVYFGKEMNLEKIRKLLKRARIKRIIENRKVMCPVCS